MNIRNFAILAMLSGCIYSASVPTVSAESYVKINDCWVREDKFQSFVVLHEEGNKYYPYFISPWCNVRADGYPEGLGFIPYIKALKFSGDDGALRRALLFDHDLQATAPTHSPLPKESDPIYIYVGSIEQFESDGFRFYRILSPNIFRRTELNLLHLTEKTPENRFELFMKLRAQ